MTAASCNHCCGIASVSPFCPSSLSVSDRLIFYTQFSLLQYLVQFLSLTIDLALPKFSLHLVVQVSFLPMSLTRILLGGGEFLALRLSEPLLDPQQKPSANHISPERGHTLRILLNSMLQDSTIHGSKCVKVNVLVAQSCPTLCDPVDCSPLGSSVHGILQAGIVEWVAMLASWGSSPPRD